jgi:hypothetical protein
VTTERDPAYAGPHDEAEVSVLGAAFLEPEAADFARARLTTEHFEHAAHRIVFAAVDSLRSRGFEAGAIAVADELESSGLLVAAGGRERLAWIVDTVPTAANVRYHVVRLQEDAYKRRFLAGLERMEKLVRSNGRPTAELHALAMEELAKYATEAGEPTLRTLADYLADPDALNPPPVVVPRVAARERVTMLAAEEKLGKSTLAAAAVAALTSGADFLGEPIERGVAVVVQVDEHPRETIRTLVRFRADPNRTYIVTDRELGADRIAGVARVVRAVAPDLTVIDSLWKLTAGKIEDSRDAGAWAPSLAAITAIARDTGTGLLVLHHARKSDGRYRDSSAIGAAVDLILEMKAGDETSREVRARGRWPASDFTVRLHGDPGDPTSPMWYSVEAGALPLSTRVLVYVQTHPECSKSQVRAGVEGGDHEIDRELERLLARGAILNRGTEMRWKLEASQITPPRSATVGATVQEAPSW